MNDSFGQLDVKIEASHAEQPAERKYVTSVTRISRQASAPVRPWPIRTSACRSFRRISWDLYRLCRLLAIGYLLLKTNTQDGPLFGGQLIDIGAGVSRFLVRSRNLRASGRHRAAGSGFAMDRDRDRVPSLLGMRCRGYGGCRFPPKEQVDSSDVGLALLGFASGIMDALAFFNLGEVFPSAMTGNTALLGLALGQGHVVAASRPFVAFVGFLTGAAAAAAICGLRASHGASIAFLPFAAVVGAAGFLWRAGQQDGSGT